MTFIDYYGENSCTAGRSSFITGQLVFLTGLIEQSVPRAPPWVFRKEDITIAEALKPLGYATGQFGKNHLGDRDEYPPTAHGFDEFFGASTTSTRKGEPERPYYPKNDAAFVKGFSPWCPPLVCRRQDRGHRPPEPYADGDHRRRKRRKP